MSEKIKISSIVIAKNEENNIKRSIESQLSCVDEIVVLVDEHSSDTTFEIVKSYPAIKCEVVKWMGYSQTKQYAVSLTTNDWIFWIDADEVITKELSQELNKFKNTDTNFSAYTVPRLANFLGRWIKHSGWYPGRVTRLFNKKFARFSQKNVHENLIVEGKTGSLHSDLLHYTDPSIKHYFEKFNNYTSLAAEELAKKNKKFSVSGIIVRPFFIFIKMYFLKRGFLDGIQGFILAVFSSAYVFTKYCKFWEAKNKDKNKNQ
ncbi:MAG: glycosyltransferase family 2 protein [Ignavibacteriaceae bacterium]